jgi:hypothetical protein
MTFYSLNYYSIKYSNNAIDFKIFALLSNDLNCNAKELLKVCCESKNNLQRPKTDLIDK